MVMAWIIHNGYAFCLGLKESNNIKQVCHAHVFFDITQNETELIFSKRQHKPFINGAMAFIDSPLEPVFYIDCFEMFSMNDFPQA